MKKFISLLLIVAVLLVNVGVFASKTATMATAETATEKAPIIILKFDDYACNNSSKIQEFDEMVTIVREEKAVAGLGIIGGWVYEGDTDAQKARFNLFWENTKRYIGYGMEIWSHGWDHGSNDEGDCEFNHMYTDEEVRERFGKVLDLVEENTNGYKITTFGAPFNKTDDACANIVNEYFPQITAVFRSKRDNGTINDTFNATLIEGHFSIDGGLEGLLENYTPGYDVVALQGHPAEMTKERRESIREVIRYFKERGSIFMTAAQYAEYVKALSEYRKNDADKAALLCNNKLVMCDVAPYTQDGITMIPLCTVGENLGARVSMDEDTQTVTLKKGNRSIIVKAGASIATVNRQTKALETPAVSNNGEIMVPIELMADAFNAETLWDEARQMAVVTIHSADEEEAMTVSANNLSVNGYGLMGSTTLSLKNSFDTTAVVVTAVHNNETQEFIRATVSKDIELIANTTTQYEVEAPYGIFGEDKYEVKYYLWDKNTLEPLAPSTSVTATPGWGGGKSESVQKATANDLGGAYEGYYMIKSPEDLVWFADNLKAEPNANAVLCNDIYLNYFEDENGDFDDEWYLNSANVPKAWDNTNLILAGKFDGRNNTIYGLYDLETTGAGLFKKVTGEIKNLNVLSGCIISNSANSEGSNYHGMLVSEMNYPAVIDSVTTSGLIKTASGKYAHSCGGVVGAVLTNTAGQNTYIKNCTSNVDIDLSNGGTAVNTKAGYNGQAGVGGIAGSAIRNANIENCVNNGTINAPYTKFVGGIIGVTRNRSTSSSVLTSNKNYGDIAGYSNVGQIIGYSRDNHMNENTAGGLNLNASTCLGSSISAPTASVASGEVAAGTVVTLTAPVPSIAASKIYYSINDGEYLEYTAPLPINTDTTIKAYTTYNGIKTGVVTYAYTVIVNPGWGGGKSESVQKATANDLDGTYEGYYMIKSPEDLVWFADNLKAEPNANAVLCNDIYLNYFEDENGDFDDEWYLNSANVPKAWDNTNLILAGKFDGRNNTIYGLYDIETNGAGLFKKVTGEIKNLNVLSGCIISNSANSEGSNYHGMLVSEMNYPAVIDTVTTSGLIKTASGKYAHSCGGVVGGVMTNTAGQNTYIKNCTSNVDIDLSNGGTTVNTKAGYNGNAGVGGIVGSAIRNANIENCINNGTIKAPYTKYVGGIIGVSRYKSTSSTVLTNNKNNGDIAGYSYVGQIIGNSRDSHMKENDATGVNMNASMCLGSAISAPTASVASGEVAAGTVVTLTAPVPSIAANKIYYSINDGEYLEYTAPLPINTDATIKAYTMYNGIKTGVVTFTYTVMAE